MADAMLAWNPSIGYFDLVIANSTVQSGDDLETAVILSLFTWKRDLTYGQFGWWGDTYSTTGLTGSRLPEMLRAYFNSEANIILRLNDIIAECLQWMIDTNVVASFDISSTFVTRTAISALITAHKPNGTTQTYNYAWSWNELLP